MRFGAILIFCFSLLIVNDLGLARSCTAAFVAPTGCSKTKEKTIRLSKTHPGKDLLPGRCAHVVKLEVMSDDTEIDWKRLSFIFPMIGELKFVSPRVDLRALVDGVTSFNLLKKLNIQSGSQISDLSPLVELENLEELHIPLYLLDRDVFCPTEKVSLALQKFCKDVTSLPMSAN